MAQRVNYIVYLLYVNGSKNYFCSTWNKTLNISQKTSAGNTKTAVAILPNLTGSTNKRQSHSKPITLSAFGALCALPAK